MASRLAPFLMLLLSGGILAPTGLVAQDMGGGGMMGGGMEGGMGDRPGGGGGRHGGPPSGGNGGPRMVKPMRPVQWTDVEKEVRKAFAAADLNHDGFVTLEEVHAALDAKRDARIAATFDSIDSNKDHKISPEEFAVWQRKMGDPEMVVLTRSDGTGSPPPAPGADDRGADFGGGALRRLIAPITAASLIEADSDHDMKLSAAEHMAYERARFDALDTDKDGEISGEELRAARGKGAMRP